MGKNKQAVEAIAKKIKIKLDKVRAKLKQRIKEFDASR